MSRLPGLRLINSSQLEHGRDRRLCAPSSQGEKHGLRPERAERTTCRFLPRLDGFGGAAHRKRSGLGLVLGCSRPAAVSQEWIFISGPELGLKYRGSRGDLEIKGLIAASQHAFNVGQGEVRMQLGVNGLLSLYP